MVRLSGPPTSARSTPAVLVAERDLQVEHLLAVALEAEMPRLDDAGVHRAHRHLVDLLAVAREEVSHAGNRRRGQTGSRLSAYGGWKRIGLSQGWPPGNAPLLGDLALEPVGLRAVGGQRRIRVPPPAVRRTESAPPVVVGQDGDEIGRRSAARACPKNAAMRAAGRDASRTALAELRESQAAGCRAARPLVPLTPRAMRGHRHHLQADARASRSQRAPAPAGCTGPARAPTQPSTAGGRSPAEMLAYAPARAPCRSGALRHAQDHGGHADENDGQEHQIDGSRRRLRP